MNFSIFSLWRPNVPSQREGRLLPQRIIVHQGQEGLFDVYALTHGQPWVQVGIARRRRGRLEEVASLG